MHGNGHTRYQWCHWQMTCRHRRCNREEVEVYDPFDTNIEYVYFQFGRWWCNPSRKNSGQCSHVETDLPIFQVRSFDGTPHILKRDKAFDYIQGKRVPPKNWIVCAPLCGVIFRDRLRRDLAYDGIQYREYGGPINVTRGIMVYCDGGGEWDKLLYVCGTRGECGVDPAEII